ncbi:hypothetical protein THASP1DRAFT_12384 [Thamnocephalis sphaerospora]|uniref:Peptide hydrolase n=1 Tax=Thamnocephalis sphaerospora TaxID=78915 RepID=A0A4P9XWV2_9FUNG|nr:hypothetical protein THASP1DRAFT_12384 [Thamnocephalis sphaerospora]|eukprot:RKP10784.1 hypothetical protein THASP1DRAFT_12384 [Thamnocephalis sphaerospora]
MTYTRALLALFVLAAASSVQSAPAGQDSFGVPLPSGVAKFSPEGFPITNEGTELHLVQTEADVPATWVPEARIWELKQKDVDFMDITLQPNLARNADETRRKQQLPKPKNFAPSLGASQVLNEIQPIIDSTNTELIKSSLTKLTSFYNRYYRSTYGTQSATWLFEEVKRLAGQAKPGLTVTVNQFKHSFNQPSVIARIDGEAGVDETVIIGSHQDSVNSQNRQGRAPGADDDGSGTSSVLEAFRALIASDFKPKRPIEFHWYAGEEAGLLGSQDIAASYQNAGRKVAGMLQLDMTGTPANGRPNEIGFVSDNVNEALTKTVEGLADQVLPGVTHKRFRCGYGCSDHASWTKAGYPSAFPFESAGLSDNRNIHSTADTIDKVNFDHVLRFSKLAIAYAVTLSSQ